MATSVLPCKRNGTLRVSEMVLFRSCLEACYSTTVAKGLSLQRPTSPDRQRSWQQKPMVSRSGDVVHCGLISYARFRMILQHFRGMPIGDSRHLSNNCAASNRGYRSREKGSVKTRVGLEVRRSP